jgi:N-acetylmuramoyl-L-alanine amidase
MGGEADRGKGLVNSRFCFAIALATLGLGFAHPIFAASADSSSAANDKPACDRGSFGIVVDVGHTQQAPGADSARGTTEYDFNLRLGQRVERELVDAGFTRAKLLVTEGKTRPGLAQRIARANESGANLFLSIHHDSVPEKFKKTWEFQGRKHQYSDRFSGYSLFVSADSSQYPASLLFGRFLGNELHAHGLLYTPHYTEDFMGNRKRQLVDLDAGVYRYDALLVLKHTHMPAVLLEAGMIVNREDELALAAPERQTAISSAVADAVEGFCEVRTAQHALMIAKGPQVERPPVLAAKKSKLTHVAHHKAPTAKRTRIAKNGGRVASRSGRIKLSSRSAE